MGRPRGRGRSQYGLWSPDGKSLVFVSARTGDGDLYYVEDISKYLGKEPKRETKGAFTRLTTTTGEEMFPSFSPNGRLIVFTSTRGGGTPQLYVMTAEGQNQLALPMERGAAFTPDWGPLTR